MKKLLLSAFIAFSFMISMQQIFASETTPIQTSEVAVPVATPTEKVEEVVVVQPVVEEKIVAPVAILPTEPAVQQESLYTEVQNGMHKMSMYIYAAAHNAWMSITGLMHKKTDVQDVKIQSCAFGCYSIAGGCWC